MRTLRAQGFAPLLIGQSVNAIGNWVAIIAIWGFAAFEFDAGADDLALLFVVLSVPGAVLGPLLGVAIDRVGPRRTFFLSNIVGLVTALALTQADTYNMVIALALPLGLVEALASASLDTITPRLVGDEDLVAGNALLGAAQDSAVITGPALAALLNSIWGLSAAFLADAATFLVGAAVALRLQVGHAPEERVAAPAHHELRDGVRLVRGSAALRWTLGTATLTYALWAVAGILEPLYVRDVLEASDTTFALIQTVFGIGMVGTGVLVARLGDRIATPRTVALAVIASGAASAAYFGTKSVAFAYLGVFLWGIDVAFFLAPVKTLLQRSTPAEAHGRVLSINTSLEPAAAVMLAPLAGFALGYISVQTLALTLAVCVTIAGVIALRTSPTIESTLAIDEPADGERLGSPTPLAGTAPG